MSWVPDLEDLFLESMVTRVQPHQERKGEVDWSVKPSPFLQLSYKPVNTVTLCNSQRTPLEQVFLELNHDPSLVLVQNLVVRSHPEEEPSILLEALQNLSLASALESLGLDVFELEKVHIFLVEFLSLLPVL